MKTWFLRFTNADQTELAKQISEDSELDVTLSIVNSQMYRLHEKIFPNACVLDNNKLCALKFDSFSNKHEIPPISRQSTHYQEAMQLLDRFERKSGELIYEERTFLLHAQWNYWFNLFKSNTPDLILFCDIPHMYYEPIILEVAKNFNVRCLILYDFNLSHHHILNQDYIPMSADHGVPLEIAAKDKYAATLSHQVQEFDQILNNDHLSFIKAFWLILRKLAKIFLIGWKVYPNGYYIRRGYLKFSLNSYFNECLYEIKYILKCVFYKILYSLFSSEKIPSNYVYLPLCCNYENTLHPTISPADLNTVIYQAYLSLKHGETLILREHPAQFRYRPHQRFSREIRFYTYWMKYKNIKFVSLKVNHFELIRNSDRVIALSESSSFLEANVLEKRVQVYGNQIRSLIPEMEENNKKFYTFRGSFFRKQNGHVAKSVSEFIKIKSNNSSK